MDLDRRVGRAAANRVITAMSPDRRAGITPGCRFTFRSGRWCAPTCRRAWGEGTWPITRRPRTPIYPAPDRALAVGGLPATGKHARASTRAEFGAAPGALVLRSDETPQAGIWPRAGRTAGADAYDAAANARTDAVLLDMLRDAATAAQAIIVDATCIDPGFRAALASAARAAGRRFLGLWLQAPQDELERRIAARERDASDATVAVLRYLRRHDPGAGTWRAVAADDAAAGARGCSGNT